MKRKLEEILNLSNDERIKIAQKECWIKYGSAAGIINEIERLLKFPTRARMPNLIIVGDTNNGKTSILNYFLRKYPAIENEEGEAAIIPLVKVQTPTNADEGRFLDLILNEFNAPFSPNSRPSVKYHQIKTIAPQIKLSALLIDEIHDILAGHKSKQRQLRSSIRQLSSDLRIPFIAAGTPEALNAINTDPQLANRFTPFFLPKWKLLYCKDEKQEPFLRLLSAYQEGIPLRNPFNLANKHIAEKLLIMSEGLLGEIASILSMAVEKAILTGEERINLKILDSIRWIVPSDRNKTGKTGLYEI